MSAALLLLARKYWQQIAVAVAVGLFIGWLAAKAYNRGVADTENKHQQATKNQLQQRNDTNEAVRTFSDARKCRSLGGVFRNGRCE